MMYSYHYGIAFVAKIKFYATQYKWATVEGVVGSAG